VEEAASEASVGTAGFQRARKAGDGSRSVATDSKWGHKNKNSHLGYFYL